MAKIAFLTFGCSLNASDSEQMMGILSGVGFELVKNADDADLIVVNGCTVKNLAEKKFFREIDSLIKKGKKVVAAGCVAQAEPDCLKSKLRYVSVIGTNNIDDIVCAVQETLEGNIVHLFDDNAFPQMNIPRVRRNSIIGIVPISRGCLGCCSYCKTRFARGQLKSYKINEILSCINSSINDGCKEIWLTSQDCGAYGKDIGTDIAKLLNKVLAIKGEFYVRLGMMNPNFVLQYLDELIEIYRKNKGKLFWFLHIPMQSGSDRILRLMKRKYSSDNFVSICKRFRDEMPEMTISTDIICGFPTETEEEFDESLKLIETVEPDVINISRFWPRPGTEAALMKGQIIGRETNKRSRILRQVFQNVALNRNSIWKGWSGSIIIDERGSIGEGKSWVGRNFAYKPVVVKNECFFGRRMNVIVSKCYTYYLSASEIKSNK